MRKLLLGQGLSMLGYAATLTVLGWYAYDVGGGPAAAGVVLAALAFSSVTSLVAGGVIGDRWDRRRIMIASDVGRGLTMAIMVLTSAVDVISVPILVALVVVIGLFDGIFQPALGSIVPELVPPTLLSSANGALAVVRASCGIVGPSVGGIVYARAGPGEVFSLTAATFLMAALVASRLRVVNRPAGGPLRPWRDVKEGAGYILGVPLLWSIPVAAVAIMFAEGATQVLLPSLVRNAYGQNADAMGYLQTGIGGGALCGALLYMRIAPQRRRTVYIYSAWAAAHLCGVVLGLGPPLIVAIGCNFVRGLLGAFGFAMWETLLMSAVERDKLARVVSLNLLGSKTLLPVGFMIAGWLGQHLQPSILISVGQGIAMLLMASLLALPKVRNFD